MQAHNPQVDWSNHFITFSRDPMHVACFVDVTFVRAGSNQVAHPPDLVGTSSGLVSHSLDPEGTSSNPVAHCLCYQVVTGSNPVAHSLCYQVGTGSNPVANTLSQVGLSLLQAHNLWVD